VSSSSTAVPRGRRPAAGRPQLAIAWARIGRIVLVLVVLLLASSYVRPLLDWFDARGQAAAQEQRLQELSATAKRLRAEKARLMTERGMVEQAQELGMVSPGQRLYVVRGLPKD